VLSGELIPLGVLYVVVLVVLVVGRHAEISRAIIDKNVVVPEGVKIGVDKEHDRARGFVVSPGGIIVVGKGQVVIE
jgi:glucose-1-phosphate adenylyltransferase